jgi:hypothetical protein
MVFDTVTRTIGDTRAPLIEGSRAVPYLFPKRLHGASNKSRPLSRAWGFACVHRLARSRARDPAQKQDEQRRPRGGRLAES